MAWTRFFHPDQAYEYTRASLRKAWKRLHAGDAERCPTAGGLVQTCAIARVEYANALTLPDGKQGLERVTQLCRGASLMQPQDAMERLAIELAKQQTQN